MISNPREDAAIAALRDWLTTHLGSAASKALAAHYGLSLVCVQDLIQDERRRRRQLAQPVVPDPVTPEPDPRTVGEDAFLAHLGAGQVDPEADTVHSLTLRFQLSEVYVKTRLAEEGIRLTPTRRRDARTSPGTR